MIGQEEINLVNGLTSFMSEKPIILDVGSNKSQWADIMLNEFGDNCWIHLFEPNKMLLDYCRIKYEYNKNINYCSLAAYKENNLLLSFYYFENFNNELSSLYKQDWWETELPMKIQYVITVRLDTYCEDHNIEYVDFIKIDCEGADVDVLNGCKKLLETNSIKFIQIEYGGHYQVAKKTFQDVIFYVNQYSYKVYSYDEKTNNYNEVKEKEFIEDYHYENYIITKEEIHNYSMNGGWLAAFRESVKDLPKFNFMMEVGSYEGLTAKYMCENMLEEGGRMIVVDPLKDYYTKEDDNNAYPYFKQQYQRFLRNTKGLPIELFRDDSRTVLPKFHAFRFDFIYIDGNHEDEVVYRDSVNCFPILKDGGYILWDDYDTYTIETKAGIDRFLNEYENQYVVIKKDYQLLIRKN